MTVRSAEVTVLISCLHPVRSCCWTIDNQPSTNSSVTQTKLVTQTSPATWFPRPPGSCCLTSLPVVGPEVVLLQRNGLPRRLPERVVRRAVVGGRRVDRRLRLFRGLDPQ